MSLIITAAPDKDNDYDGPSTTAKGGAMIAPPASLIEKDRTTLNVLHPEVNFFFAFVLLKLLEHRTFYFSP